MLQDIYPYSMNEISYCEIENKKIKSYSNLD